MPTSTTAPRLAVIIPIYKVEPYLRQCLDSVCAQSYPHLKIILVDDGSPDGCGAICDEYAARDPRIHVIHQENRGLSGARNSGLKLATDCPYITYLDSDDWLDLNIYQQCIECLEADPELELVQFGMRYVGDDLLADIATEDLQLSTTEDICTHFILGGKNQVTPSVCDKVFRASLITGITFREGYNWEDIGYMMEALYHTKRVRLLETLGYFYRVNRTDSISNNVCVKDVSALFANLEYLIERYAEDQIFVGYVNALQINQLWNYWSMLNPYPKRYRELTPHYLPFAQRASKRPFPNLFPHPKDYRKRQLFLRFPKTYMGIRAWLRRRHRKHKNKISSAR